jgi:hypothetical protein
MISSMIKAAKKQLEEFYEDATDNIEEMGCTVTDQVKAIQTTVSNTVTGSLKGISDTVAGGLESVGKKFELYTEKLMHPLTSLDELEKKIDARRAQEKKEKTEKQKKKEENEKRKQEQAKEIEKDFANNAPVGQSTMQIVYDQKLFTECMRGIKEGNELLKSVIQDSREQNEINNSLMRRTLTLISTQHGSIKEAPYEEHKIENPKLPENNSKSPMENSIVDRMLYPTDGEKEKH